MTKLYRLFNYSMDDYGEPFAMCDKHAAEYNPPALQNGFCRLDVIADQSRIGCMQCWKELQHEMGQGTTG